MLGLSIGYFIAPPLHTYLIRTHSWRGALLISGAMVSHIIAFGSLYQNPQTPAPIVTDEHKDVEQISFNIYDRTAADQPIATTDETSTHNHKSNRLKTFLKDVFDFGVMKQYQFVMLCVASMMCRYAGGTFMNHIPSKAVHIGVPKVSG